MSFKDMYIEEFQRIADELEAAGIDPDQAYELAANTAYEAARDRLAEMADAIRQREKDERQ